MSFFYKIVVDRTDANFISGWCFYLLNRHEKVELAIYLNGMLLGVTTADLFREDLRELDIHPTGYCGFELVINKTPDELKGHHVLSIVDRKNNKQLAKIKAADFSVIKKGGIIKIFKDLLSFSRRKRPPILFMHIPKTAGTSFNTFIRYLNKYEKAISHIEATNETDYHDLNLRYNYISGHLRYGIFRKYFCDQNNDLYTIIREPYARLHSHFKWMKRSIDERFEKSLKNHKSGIYNLRLKIKNLDFNDLERLKQFVDDISGAEAAFFDNLQTRYFLIDRVEKVFENDLEQALMNTSKFKLIGLTEQYSDFLEAFTRLNNLKSKIQTSTLNKSTQEPLFDINDSEIRNILHPLVCHDLILYEDVRNTFVTWVNNAG